MASAENNRDKALDVALANIDKQFGKGSVMRLGDEVRAPLEVIPTGAISLDIALGLGGLPRGRVVEIYGPESSGKTTVALHAVANPVRPEASSPSSTPSTRSTPTTPSGSGWFSGADLLVAHGPIRTPFVSLRPDLRRSLMRPS